MATNWKKQPKVLEAVVISSPGATQVVPARGRLELRVYTTYSSAIAGGLNPQSAKAHFRKRDSCGGGECVTNFSKDLLLAWCTDFDCVSQKCECHLFEMWTDEDGVHDEDRGYPGKGWRYKVKPGRGYGCRCALAPI
jgi:hypothetical protein